MLRPAHVALFGGDPQSPALDLAFARDGFTARRGLLPTFTRASTGTFVGSNGLIQSAAINVPRIDYDPATLACKGLLIEEQRTNLAKYSSGCDTSNSSGNWYVSSGANVTRMGNTTSPSGDEDATIYKSLTASFAYIAQNTPVTSGVTYTVSVWAKRVSGSGTSGNLLFYYANALQGAISVAASGISNSWQRFSLTFTSNFTGTGFIGLLDSNNNGGEFAFWGAQVEVGAFPSSFIPTTSATATRSADVCSMPLASIGYNPNEGTLAVEFDTIAPAAFSVAHLGTDAAGTPHINKLGGNFYAANFGSAPSIIINDTASYPGAARAAYGYRPGDSALAVNGTVVTNATATAFGSNSTLFIGNNGSGTQALNGHVSRLRYFRRRLTDSKLQALTS